MKPRSFVGLLLTTVIVLLALGLGGFGWLWWQSPLRLLQAGRGAVPQAAIFVPRQAPLVASMLVNPEQLAVLRELQSPLSERPQAIAEVDAVKDTILGRTRIDYDRDIRAWLGQELTLAVTTPDLDRNATNGLQVGYLLAMTVQKASAAKEFLQVFWQQRALTGSELVFDHYKGITIISAQASLTGQSLPPLASALVGDRFLLFANNPKVLREAINNVQVQELNLATSAQYRTAIQSLDQGRLGFSFVNLPALLTWLQQADIVQSEAWSETLAPYQSLVTGLNITAQGLKADAYLVDRRFALQPQAATQAPAVTPASQPPEALHYLPGDTAIAITGQDLKQTWQHVSEWLTSTPLGQELVTPLLAPLQAQLQLDLPPNLFDWSEGDYAIAAVPTVTAETRQQLDWLLVADRTAPGAEIEAALQDLDQQALEQGYGLTTIELKQAKSTPPRMVKAWARLAPTVAGLDAAAALKAQVRGLHTTVDHYEVFATSLEAIRPVLSSDRDRLDQAESFQQTTAAIASDNQGYLYLDWRQARPVLERQIPVLRLVELAAKPVFEHLQGLSISRHPGSENLSRGSLSVSLID